MDMVFQECSEQAVSCWDLNEQQCKETKGCSPFYGGSSPWTNDIVFKGCLPYQFFIDFNE